MVSILEILSKFERGQELYQTSTLFNKCVNCLAAGQDIYKLLEEVIIISDNQAKHTEEILQKSSPTGIFKRTRAGG